MALHVTIRRKEFLAAFGKVSPAVPTKSPRAILQNIKFVADEDAGCTLTGTDLEVGISHKVYGVTVLSPGAAVLPTAKVSSILSTSTAAELDISIEGDHIVIRSETATFRLPSEDPTLFPELPTWGDEGYFEVPAAGLRTCIRRTVMCCDPESTRYALGGCLMEFADHGMTMVATDGRRLAKMTIQCELVGDVAPPEKGPVIPEKAAKLLDKNLDDPELTVHLTLVGNGSAVLVRTSDRSVTVYSRLVEGRFPRYQDVFPGTCEVRIPIDAEQLRHVVEQASIVTSDESRGVDFSFSGDILTLSSQAADVGSSQITMPVSYEGGSVDITFDPRYLSDALKTIDDDCLVTAELIDHKNAAVFKTEDGYSYVVMPLTSSR